VTEYVMPADEARSLLAALQSHGVSACVGGGWSVDASVGTPTRPHVDLDLWVAADQAEGLLATLVAQGVDQIHPWPGDRPWNFVLHDGRSRRVDLHFYEALGGERLQYGSVNAPFLFSEQDLSGEGVIDGLAVRCERPEFALNNRLGYPARDVDAHDVALLCSHFGLERPEGFA
jgi:lincosamide nucleotidyltransferase A/C/D/E